LKIRLALVLAAALLTAGTLLAPAALAVTATVRAEAAGYTAIGPTAVEVPAAGGLVADSDGSTYTTTIPTPLNALDLATQIHGVPWDMVVSSLGAYVNAIDGQTSDPSTFANWWQFNVNGYSPSVGAGALQANAGDSYLFFQNPDAGWPVAKTPKALVVRLSAGTALAANQSFTISVVGDDLTKVNSQAEATRFDITDASQIETSDQFAPVDGATVHVGSRVYTPAGSTVTVSGLPDGTYKVWAEKAMDSSLVYVRSQKTIVTVGTSNAAPVISNVSAAPTRFRRNHALTVRFTLDKPAVATVSIRSAAGVLLSRTTKTYTAAGATAIKWNGRTTRKLGGKLKVSILAVDAFGNRTFWSTLSVPVRH